MALSNKEKYSFGIGAFGKDLILAYANVFLMIYLTDVLFIAPAFVGSLFFIARIWDSINDPIMGMIVDNTHNKFGKFRTWISIGTITNALCFIAMFCTFGLQGKALYIYISIIYILYGMTYTILDIPYWAWLPNLTNIPHEREEIGVIPRIFASCSYLILGVVSFHLIYFFNNIFGNGNKNAEIGYTLGAVTIAIIYIITISITVFNVKEKSSNEQNEKLSLNHIWNILTKNKHLKSYIAVLLTFYLFDGLYENFMVYYLKYVAGNQDLFSVFSAAKIAQLFGLFAFPFITKKIGRNNTYKIACLIPIIGFCILGFSAFVNPASKFLLSAATIFMKGGSGLALGTITVLVADVIDYNQIQFGTRNESIICSTQTFLVKTCGAVSALLTGLSLSILKYNPLLPKQADITIFGLRCMIFIPSLIFAIASLLIYIKCYKLKGKELEIVREKIATINN